MHSFMVGTSKGTVNIFDAREKTRIMVLENGCSVTSVHYLQDARHVMTADAEGMVRTWDIRTRKCLHEMACSTDSISTLTFCKNHDDDSSIMAINSANAIHIYHQQLEQEEQKLKLLQSVEGASSLHHPIRLSFYEGNDYALFEKRDSDGEDNPQPPKTFDTSLLLASGSTDRYAYLFDISDIEDAGSLLQRLEGHEERVYSVDFHPTEPTLATSSADFTVKIWAPANRIKKKLY
jgi:COMPASS component SWD3